MPRTETGQFLIRAPRRMLNDRDVLRQLVIAIEAEAIWLWQADAEKARDRTGPAADSDERRAGPGAW